MSVAFVLSGGASLGAVQVGMLRALVAHDIRPDLVVGTSVGAVNGAFLASREFGPQAVDYAGELIARGEEAARAALDAAAPRVVPLRRRARRMPGAQLPSAG